MITEPCVIADMDEAAYHQDPVPGGSLSSGGARTLLEPGGPARFAHWRGVQRNTTTFDIGKALHTVVLGAGAGITRVDAGDWKTKKAQQAQAGAYAAGQIPILEKDYQRVLAMAAALEQHPDSSVLLAAPGDAEQSLFWTDEKTSAWCRARHDRAIRDRNGRLVIVDVKTCEKADDRSISRSIGNYGYHQQDDWYRRPARALGLDEDPGFVFIFVEKTPPHLVNVVQLNADDLDVGRRRNDAALRLYADCTRTGVWPGYDTGITEISLPAYYPRQEF